ncbi:hypothetical protein CSAL01_03710 [Colletotrichum salicis]|uniref:Uncharacterized protein n=1 Tax=Colletotrichum salicis TaxID=1209931 RepID=A0A135V6B6_9PEZI|nr:hypothetical protein CSAL01_03710 [Colletotrichum salicis]
MASRGIDENEGPDNVRGTISPATDHMAQDPVGDSGPDFDELPELPKVTEADPFGFDSDTDELHELPEITDADPFVFDSDESELSELPKDTEEDLFGRPEDDAEDHPPREYNEPLPARLAREHDRYRTRINMAHVPDDDVSMTSVYGFDGAYDFEPSGSFQDPAAIPTKPNHAVETPRTVKALRVSDGVHDGKGTGAKKSGSGVAKVLNFDPSPKHYLGLGNKMKATASPEADSAMAIDKPDTERGPSTPPPGFRYEEGHGIQTPGRPRSVKTAPTVMFADTDIEEDNSPSNRRQMNRVRTASASKSVSLERPSVQPAGPRPFGPEPEYYEPISTGVPATPTKANGKRSRGHFDKTLTLAGKDVANMKDIMVNFALATDENVDDTANGDGEDGDVTPKASILNSHMDIDEN